MPVSSPIDPICLLTFFPSGNCASSHSYDIFFRRMIAADTKSPLATSAVPRPVSPPLTRSLLFYTHHLRSRTSHQRDVRCSHPFLQTRKCYHQKRFFHPFTVRPSRLGCHWCGSVIDLGVVKEIEAARIYRIGGWTLFLNARWLIHR
jgi:hypothetical protein